jgi:hypothetical protein
MAIAACELTANVNDRVRERSYASSDEPISFFCECGEHCFRTIWLTADEFDAWRAFDLPVVVDHPAHAGAAA